MSTAKGGWRKTFSRKCELDRDGIRKLNVLVLEGFILIIVVLLHTAAPQYVRNIFSYGVPVLWFIRGYQWKDRKLKEQFQARVQLILTYYVSGFLGTILFVLFAPPNFIVHRKSEYFINLLLARVETGDEIALPISPIWFLMALFVSDLLYSIYRRVSKWLLPYYLGILLIILVRPLISQPGIFRIGTAVLGVPFIELGAFFKKSNLRVRAYSFLLFILLLLVISHYNGHVDWYTHDFKNIFLTYLGEVSMIIAATYLGELLTRSNLKNILEKVAINALFIIPYHGIIGILLAFLYFPFLRSYDGVLQFVSRFWYFHFLLEVAVLLGLVQHMPTKLKRILIGDARFPKFLRTPKYIR